MNTNPEGFLTLNRIEDSKIEKIAFILDLHDEMFKEDFTGVDGNKQDRFSVIMEHILNYVKLKDYFSSKTEFAFYIYTSALHKEVEFCNLKEFVPSLMQFRNNFKLDDVKSNGSLDLAEIFLDYFLKANSSQLSMNEITFRYILFYNRSKAPAIISNPGEFNSITFIRLTNFFFDVIFLRKKINNDEEKRMLTEIFNSLTSVKPKFWYAFENSGNLIKFKYIMDLLLANPNQRVKLSEIEKHQKKVDELIKNFSES